VRRKEEGEVYTCWWNGNGGIVMRAPAEGFSNRAIGWAWG
jgi:hypothetical protein